MKVLLQLLAASTALSSAVAFTIPTPNASKIGRATSSSASLPNDVAPPMSRNFGVWRQMTSDGDSEAATESSPKRRTRKDGKTFSPPSSAQPEIENDMTDVVAVVATQPEPVEEEAPAPPTPKQNVVVMQVRDIRDVVSGVPEPSMVDVVEDVVEVEEVEDEEGLADDEEWEYFDVDENGNEIVTSDERMGGRVQDDSMEQLLADARRMRASKPKTDDEELSVKDKIFNVISTIVTVDFFFVIALFVWFLAGIFCSYVLKDDAVQIAFNMNFEGVTRPALTVLMAGSIAGSLGNKEDEEIEY